MPHMADALYSGSRELWLKPRQWARGISASPGNMSDLTGRLRSNVGAFRSMDEHRKSQRLRIFKGGSISFASAPSIDCIIRNLSETGACLEVAGGDVPDNFTLLIKPELLKRYCKVAWRTYRRIRIRFA
jgi:hypothetical protein